MSKALDAHPLGFRKGSMLASVAEDRLCIVSYVYVDTASFAEGKGGKERMCLFFCLMYVYFGGRLLPNCLLIYMWIWSLFSTCMQYVHLSSWRRVVNLRSARVVFTEALWMRGQFIPLCGIYLFCFRTELTQKR